MYSLCTNFANKTMNILMSGTLGHKKNETKKSKEKTCNKTSVVERRNYWVGFCKKYASRWHALCSAVIENWKSCCENIKKESTKEQDESVDEEESSVESSNLKDFTSFHTLSIIVKDKRNKL